MNILCILSRLLQLLILLMAWIDCRKLLFYICKLYQVVIHLVAEGLFEPSFIVVKHRVHHLDLNIVIFLTWPANKARVVTVAQPWSGNSSAKRLDRVIRFLKRDEAAILLNLLLTRRASLRIHLSGLDVTTSGQILHQVLG